MDDDVIREILQAILSTSSMNTACELIGSKAAVLTAIRKIGETGASVSEYRSREAFEQLKQRIFDAAIRPAEFRRCFLQIRPLLRTPREYQQKAITATLTELQKCPETQNRKVSIAAACGCGKSLISYWTAQELEPKLTIFFVPTRSLIEQTLRTWLQESQSRRQDTDFLTIASELHTETLRSSKNCVSNTTDSQEIFQFIKSAFRSNGTRQKVIFSTYRSQDVVLDTLISFDLSALQCEKSLLICDEAHRLTGDDQKKMVRLLHDEKLRFANRIFMSGSPKDIVYDEQKISSYDESVFGKIAYELTFAELVENGVLADYDIQRLLDSSAQSRIAELIPQLLRLPSAENNDACAYHAASLICAIERNRKMRKTVAFHQTIEDSQRFTNLCQDAVDSGLTLLTTPTKFLHIDGSKPKVSGETLSRFRDFSETSRVILSNAKYFVEGLDVPEIDSVYFGSIRSTGALITQIVGRATRMATAGKVAQFIVPTPHDSEESETTKLSESFAHMLLNLHYLRVAKTFLQESIGMYQRQLPIDAQAQFIAQLPAAPLLTFEDVQQYICDFVDTQVLQKINHFTGNDGFKFYQHLTKLLDLKQIMEGQAPIAFLPSQMEMYQLCQQKGFDELYGENWEKARVIKVDRVRAKSKKSKK
jgi:predicted helicase